MRLLIVTPIFPPRTGGPATYIWELVQRLKQKHQLTIICLSDKPRTIEGVKIIPISTKGAMIRRQIKLLSTVFNQLGHHDYVYIQGGWVVGVSSRTAALFLHKKALLKFVGDEIWESERLAHKTSVTLEQFYQSPGLLNLLKLMLQQFVLKSVVHIITPSEYLKEVLIRFHKLDSSKITVIPNAIEIAFPKTRKSTNQLVTVGRLVPWKNIDRIIHAVKIARKHHPWNLSIVGEGPEEARLKQLTKKLNANNWITFTGRLSHLEAIKNIARAKKIILYSDYEGLSHTLIEAMLLKTEIITTNLKPNREVVGNFGQLIPLGKPKLLAAAINKSQANLIKAQQYAQRHFNWQNHLQKLGEILEKN